MRWLTKIRPVFNAAPAGGFVRAVRIFAATESARQKILGQEKIGPRVAQFRQLLRLLLRREHRDRRIVQVAATSRMRRHNSTPLMPGRLTSSKQQIGAMVVADGPGILGRREPGDRQAVAAGQLLNDHADVGLIVHDDDGAADARRRFDCRRPAVRLDEGCGSGFAIPWRRRLPIGGRRRGSVKKKVAPCAGLRLDPDAAAVPFDDFLADRQAGAGPFVFVALVQAAKDAEDLLMKRRVDADAVVAHEERHAGRDRRRPAGRR